MPALAAAPEEADPSAGEADAPPVPGPASEAYVVNASETLYSIARKLGVSVEDLRRWNALESNQIQAGQKLAYARLQTSRGAASRPAPGAAPAWPGATAVDKRFYVVKSGDSLWDISVKFRSTVAKLKELNGRLPPVLKPGTKIRVQ